MANRSTAVVAAVAKHVRLVFDKILVRLQFLIVQNLPFGTIIRVPTIETLETIMYTKRRIVRLEYRGQHVKMKMVLDKDGGEESSTDSEDFISVVEESLDAEDSMV